MHSLHCSFTNRQACGFSPYFLWDKFVMMIMHLNINLVKEYSAFVNLLE